MSATSTRALARLMQDARAEQMRAVFEQSDLKLQMWTLARNLRDAAGCALAWRLHRHFRWNWQHGDCEAWCPNLDGKPAPGWER